MDDMANESIVGFIRFIIIALEDYKKETDPQEKENKWERIMTDLKKTVEK